MIVIISGSVVAVVKVGGPPSFATDGRLGGSLRYLSNERVGGLKASYSSVGWVGYCYGKVIRSSSVVYVVRVGGLPSIVADERVGGPSRYVSDERISGLYSVES